MSEAAQIIIAVGVAAVEFALAFFIVALALVGLDGRGLLNDKDDDFGC